MSVWLLRAVCFALTGCAVLCCIIIWSHSPSSLKFYVNRIQLSALSWCCCRCCIHSTNQKFKVQKKKNFHIHWSHWKYICDYFVMPEKKMKTETKHIRTYVRTQHKFFLSAIVSAHFRCQMSISLVFCLLFLCHIAPMLNYSFKTKHTQYVRGKCFRSVSFQQ